VRIRTIKPEFWSHPILSAQEPVVRLGAIGLLNLADDEGYFMATPALVRSALFPLDEDSTNARRVLATLSSIGYIAVKNHPTHSDIGMVVNFTKHQRIDRPSLSKIKAYFDSTNDLRTIDDHSSLYQGSGIKGKEQGTGSGEVSPSAPRPKRFTHPTLEEVKAYCQERKNGIDAEQFMNRYESNGWLVGKSPMKNWQAAVRTWEKNGYRAASQTPTATSKDVGKGLRQEFPDALKWIGGATVEINIAEYGIDEVKEVLSIAKRNGICFDANEWREAFEGRRSDYGGWDFWKPRKRQREADAQRNAEAMTGET